MFGEPVAFYGVAISATYVLTEFGVDLTQGQQTAALGLVAAVLTLVTRSKVTPWSPDSKVEPWSPDERGRPKKDRTGE